MVYLAETIAKTRKFRLVHGGIINSEDTLGRRLVIRWDPLKLLVQFLNDKAIRPVDLFRRLDKDNQQLVSRDHFIQGLKKVHSPLDEYETQKVLNRLYSSKKKISYPYVQTIGRRIPSPADEEPRGREEET
ncbi:hypothetical protein NP493_153g07026 [Ridgeia piscesae]|uniref:EF-hand domain-containing protein n=1 Tax=Ridgeia piscesae TaxID=27915 RepID=A0AAD9P4D8_RIDPI|nr:hypothetical protein NP493_153g07026 [Ridgeia piscesae]